MENKNIAFQAIFKDLFEILVQGIVKLQQEAKDEKELNYFNNIQNKLFQYFMDLEEIVFMKIDLVHTRSLQQGLSSEENKLQANKIVQQLSNIQIQKIETVQKLLEFNNQQKDKQSNEQCESINQYIKSYFNFYLFDLKNINTNLFVTMVDQNNKKTYDNLKKIQQLRARGFGIQEETYDHLQDEMERIVVSLQEMGYTREQVTRACSQVPDLDIFQIIQQIDKNLDEDEKNLQTSIVDENKEEMKQIEEEQKDIEKIITDEDLISHLQGHQQQILSFYIQYMLLQNDYEGLINMIIYQVSYESEFQKQNQQLEYYLNILFYKISILLSEQNIQNQFSQNNQYKFEDLNIILQQNQKSSDIIQNKLYQIFDIVEKIAIYLKIPLNISQNVIQQVVQIIQQSKQDSTKAQLVTNLLKMTHFVVHQNQSYLDQLLNITMQFLQENDGKIKNQQFEQILLFIIRIFELDPESKKQFINNKEYINLILNHQQIQDDQTFSVSILFKFFEQFLQNINDKQTELDLKMQFLRNQSQDNSINLEDFIQLNPLYFNTKQFLSLFNKFYLKVAENSKEKTQIIKRAKFDYSELQCLYNQYVNNILITICQKIVDEDRNKQENKFTFNQEYFAKVLQILINKFTVLIPNIIIIELNNKEQFLTYLIRNSINNEIYIDLIRDLIQEGSILYKQNQQYITLGLSIKKFVLSQLDQLTQDFTKEHQILQYLQVHSQLLIYKDIVYLSLKEFNFIQKYLQLLQNIQSIQHLPKEKYNKYFILSKTLIFLIKQQIILIADGKLTTQPNNSQNDIKQGLSYLQQQKQLQKQISNMNISLQGRNIQQDWISFQAKLQQSQDSQQQEQQELTQSIQQVQSIIEIEEQQEEINIQENAQNNNENQQIQQESEHISQEEEVMIQEENNENYDEDEEQYDDDYVERPPQWHFQSLNNERNEYLQFLQNDLNIQGSIINRESQIRQFLQQVHGHNIQEDEGEDFQQQELREESNYNNIFRQLNILSGGNLNNVFSQDSRKLKKNPNNNIIINTDDKKHQKYYINYEFDVEILDFSKFQVIKQGEDNQNQNQMEINEEQCLYQNKIDLNNLYGLNSYIMQLSTIWLNQQISVEIQEIIKIIKQLSSNGANKEQNQLKKINQIFKEFKYKVCLHKYQKIYQNEFKVEILYRDQKEFEKKASEIYQKLIDIYKKDYQELDQIEQEKLKEEQQKQQEEQQQKQSEQQKDKMEIENEQSVQQQQLESQQIQQLQEQIQSEYQNQQSEQQTNNSENQMQIESENLEQFQQQQQQQNQSQIQQESVQQLQENQQNQTNDTQQNQQQDQNQQQEENQGQIQEELSQYPRSVEFLQRFNLQPNFLTQNGLNLQFFEDLPEDIMTEIVQQYLPPDHNTQQDFINNVPQELRQEVMQQQQQPAQPIVNQTDENIDFNQAAFIESLEPELREEILLSQGNEFLDRLPHYLRQEAQQLRERAQNQRIQEEQRYQEEQLKKQKEIKKIQELDLIQLFSNDNNFQEKLHNKLPQNLVKIVIKYLQLGTKIFKLYPFELFILSIVQNDYRTEVIRFLFAILQEKQEVQQQLNLSIKKNQKDYEKKIIFMINHISKFKIENSFVQKQELIGVPLFTLINILKQWQIQEIEPSAYFYLINSINNVLKNLGEDQKLSIEKQQIQDICQVFNYKKMNTEIFDNFSQVIAFFCKEKQNMIYFTQEIKDNVIQLAIQFNQISQIDKQNQQDIKKFLEQKKYNNQIFVKLFNLLQYLFKENEQNEIIKENIQNLIINKDLQLTWINIAQISNLSNGSIIDFIQTEIKPIFNTFYIIYEMLYSQNSRQNQNQIQINDKTHYIQNLSFEEFIQKPYDQIEILTFLTSKGKDLVNELVQDSILYSKQDELGYSKSLFENAIYQIFKNNLAHYVQFENKQNIFKNELKFLKKGQRYMTKKVRIHRNEIFTESFMFFDQMTTLELKQKLQIEFIGEEGIDAGGLIKEWYLLLSKEIFKPHSPLFIPTENGNTFQPCVASSIVENHLLYFKFVGRIVGKALFDGFFLDAYFSRFFYKHIIGRQLCLADMADIDQQYYLNLKKYVLEEDPTELYLTFSEQRNDLGVMKTIDLIPNGRNISVTNENKHEYILALCQFKLGIEMKSQIEAFNKGFYDICPQYLVNIFDAHELELMICGVNEIDLDDMRKYTKYVQYSESSQQMIWLWQSLEEFTSAQRSSFVQFVYGTSKVGLNGFKEQQLQIQRTGNRKALPSAHTCFNILDLPPYDSKDELKQKLLLAIQEGKEGFGFA